MSWGPRPHSAPVERTPMTDSKPPVPSFSPGAPNSGAIVASRKGSDPDAYHRLVRERAACMATFAHIDPSETWLLSVRRRALLKRKLRTGWNEGAKSFSDHLNATGALSVNLLPLSVEELSVLADGIGSARQLKCLRLKCEARGGGGGAMITDAKRHRRRRKVAQEAAANAFRSLQNARVYRRLARSLAAHITNSSNLDELEVGCTLGPVGMPALSHALCSNISLRRLSFAGSAIGDVGMAALVDGLRENYTVQELVLSGCCLTDGAGMHVASILRAHASRRAVAKWQDGLRSHPGAGMPYRAHPETFGADAEVEEGSACAAGLKLLDLSDNALTHRTCKALCAALHLDTRLEELYLKHNRLQTASCHAIEEAFIEHPALRLVDLRGNGDRAFNVLRLREELPEGATSGGGFGASPAPGKRKKGHGFDAFAGSPGRGVRWMPDSALTTPAQTPRDMVSLDERLVGGNGNGGHALVPPISLDGLTSLATGTAVTPRGSDRRNGGGVEAALAEAAAGAETAAAQGDRRRRSSAEAAASAPASARGATSGTKKRSKGSGKAAKGGKTAAGDKAASAAAPGKKKKRAPKAARTEREQQLLDSLTKALLQLDSAVEKLVVSGSGFSSGSRSPVSALGGAQSPHRKGGEGKQAKASGDADGPNSSVVANVSSQLKELCDLFD